jgi:hypothetical protein
MSLVQPDRRLNEPGLALALSPSGRAIRILVLVAAVLATVAGQLATPHRVAAAYSSDYPRGAYSTDTSNSTYDKLAGAGFNTVMTSPYAEYLGALQARGLKGVVWLGSWRNSTCSWSENDAWVRSHVTAIAGHPAVAAYYLGDEPNFGSCPSGPSMYAARTNLVHSLDPGRPTFTVIQAWDPAARESYPYGHWARSVDILGLDVYPCTLSSATCDFTQIDAAIAAADAAGVSKYWAVMQDFQDDYYRLPTPVEITAQFDRWNRSRMAGYLVFSWDFGTYNLDSQPSNVAELSRQNRLHGAGPGEPPPPSPPPPPPPTATPGGNYTALPPGRILDTRDGTGGYFGTLGANSTISVQVLNAGGVPSSGVGAVALNITADGATDSSFLTVFPGPGNPPLVSNLNFVQRQTIANLAFVNVGADGKVRVYNARGNVHVIVDVQGWFSNAPTGSAAGQFHPVPPVRLLDTRTSLGGHRGHLFAGEVMKLKVANTAALSEPVANVSSVIINLTASGHSQATFLTVYPGGDRPNASNLNVQAGTVQPNRVAVKLDTDGSVSIFLSDGDTDVIVDLNGWFGTSAAAAGVLYHGVSPFRIYDSRSPGQSMLSQGENRPLQVLGQAGVPNSAGAVVGDLAVTGSNIGSYMTVHPNDVATPLASDLNWPTGATIPNLVVVKIGADGQVAFYNALGSTNFVVDVSGWFA